MGRSSELAFAGAAGAPCSPSGDSDWQPTDPALLSERSAGLGMHTKAPAPALSPFSRRRTSEPSARGPAPPPENPTGAGDAQLFRALSECEHELIEIADRLADAGLSACSRRLGLLVSEARSLARSPLPKDVAPKRQPTPVSVGSVQRVLFVRSGRHHFGLLESSVSGVFRLNSSETAEHIESAFGAKVYRGPEHLLPLIHLSEVLGEMSTAGLEGTQIVGATFGEQPFGLVVDEVLTTEEVIVSPMHSVLRKVGLYQGGAENKSGVSALVLDVPGIAAKGGMARLSMLPTALTSDVEPQS
jgi:hypothetical protein